MPNNSKNNIGSHKEKNSRLQQHPVVFTARKRSLGQGNIFTPVCHSVHGGGGVRGCSRGGGVRGCSGGACMCGCSGGACMVARGACMVARGLCMVAPGGLCMVAPGGREACMVALGGHVWLLPGGGMGGIRRDTEIRSMSGRYASYWNAFLLNTVFTL